MRLLGMGAAPLLGALRLVTGVDLISDLTAFFTLLGGMTDEFSARAERVERLLHAPETAFVLVTSAESRPIDEAIWFRETLRENGMPFTGAIVNRMHPALSPGGVSGTSPGPTRQARASIADTQCWRSATPPASSGCVPLSRASRSCRCPSLTGHPRRSGFAGDACGAVR